MRFPEGRKKALTLSYDDAVIQDKKMMKILDDSSSMNVMKDLVNEFNEGIGKEKNIYFEYQIKENDLAKQVEVALVTDRECIIKCVS